MEELVEGSYGVTTVRFIRIRFASALQWRTLEAVPQTTEVFEACKMLH